MRLFILQKESANDEKAYPVGKGLSIGSDAGNAIQVTSGKTSKKHAKLAVVGPYVFIEDLETPSGTWVNGEKIRRTALKKGDKVKIGDTHFVYDEDDRPEPKKSKAGKKKGSSKPKSGQVKVPSASVPSDSARSGGLADSAGSGRAKGKIKLQGADLSGSPQGSSARNPAAGSGRSPGSSSRNPSQGAGVAARPGVSDGSSSLNPAVQPSVSRGSSSLNPAVRSGGGSGSSRLSAAVGGSSSRNQTVSPGASGSRMQGLSSNARNKSIKVSAQLSIAQEEAQKALDRSREATKAPKPSKMTGVGIIGMILLLVFTVLAVFLVPHYRAWQKGREAIGEKARLEQEALERLKNEEYKDPKDLKLIHYKLKAAKKWSQIEELLGEPSIRDRQVILLWQPDKGSFEQSGYELRAYRLKEEGVTESHTVFSILLFEVDEDEEVRYFGPKRYATKETPPLRIEKPKADPGSEVGSESGKGTSATPKNLSPSGEAAPEGTEGDPAGAADPAGDAGAAEDMMTNEGIPAPDENAP